MQVSLMSFGGDCNIAYPRKKKARTKRAGGLPSPGNPARLYACPIGVGTKGILGYKYVSHQ